MYKNKEIIKYDSKLSKKTYIYFKNIYSWKHIEEWQEGKTQKFPDDNNINNNDLEKFKVYFENIYKELNNNNKNKDIKEILDYTLKFDIKNKNHDIYNKRLNLIYENIISAKPIKNPNVPIFKQFSQPLFYYFINKNIPESAREFLKKPSSILGRTLLSEYDNYKDKKIDKNYEYLLFYNDKNVLLEKDGHSSSMSYIHLLCIFNMNIYNCVTINKYHYKKLINAKNNIQEFINKDDNFLKCLSEFGTRVIDFKIQNKSSFEIILLEKSKINNMFFNILRDVYNKYIYIKYDKQDIYQDLLIKLNVLNKNKIDKKLEFYFHIHPFHSVGYLHMHCIHPMFKTESWNHFIGQFIKIEDLNTLIK